MEGKLEGEMEERGKSLYVQFLSDPIVLQNGLRILPKRCTGILEVLKGVCSRQVAPLSVDGSKFFPKRFSLHISPKYDFLIDFLKSKVFITELHIRVQGTKYQRRNGQ